MTIAIRYINSLPTIVIISIIFSICNNTRAHEFDLHSLQLVKQVQKRYYFVHRMQEPMDTLIQYYRKMSELLNSPRLSLGSHKKPKNIGIDKSFVELFKNSTVHAYAQKMYETQSIEPLQQLWLDSVYYKFIDDDQFIKETIIAMIFLYKNIIMTMLDQYQNSTKSLASQKVNDNLNSIVHLLDEVYEEEDFVVYNNVRFYHIQRLIKAITILVVIADKYKVHDIFPDDHVQILALKHEEIKLCVEKMRNTQSLSPLFELWHEITSYKHIDDPCFMKEFIIVVMILYEELSKQLLSANKNVPTFDEIIDLYQKIDQLPLEQLLDALDKVVNQFMQVMQEYEVSSGGWYAWFKKYWWVGPVSLACVFIKIITMQ